jgi:Domain of unknown function (DUF4440)
MPPPTPAAHLAGGAGDGSDQRGRGWLIAAVVLVLALVAGGAAFVLLGDDDKDDDGASESTEGTSGTDTTAPPGTGSPESGLAEPVDVAQAFFTAAVAGDCPAMAGLLTEGSLLMENDTVEEGLAECEESVSEGTSGFEGVSVGNISLVSVDGDVAIISADFTIEGQASTEQFHLQRVDGEWRMDLEASA